MELRKRGLGRGLGALIPGTAQPEPSRKEEAESWAETGAIQPNPFQPRAVFDEPGLDELTASIRDASSWARWRERPPR